MLKERLQLNLIAIPQSQATVKIGVEQDRSVPVLLKAVDYIKADRVSVVVDEIL
jgi:hypothetical protein